MSEAANGLSGQIELICGPMFSGKTEELIRRLKRAQIARQQVWIFKPKIDDRYDEIQIVSHSAQKLHSIPVDNTADVRTVWENYTYKPDVIGIDEIQFFDEDLLPLCEEMAEEGVRVIVAGLDLDYMAKPFGIMPNFLSVAERVSKQAAICVACGSPASRSQRVDVHAAGEEKSAAQMWHQQVFVGASQDYEARCRRCFVRGIDTPTIHTEMVIPSAMQPKVA